MSLPFDLNHLSEGMETLKIIESFLPRDTASIKMHEIDHSHVKETSFTCSLVIN